jgi:hypothetical protein
VRETVDLIAERDRLRAQNLLDPGVAELNQSISDSTAKEANKRWQDEVEAAGPHAYPDKFWRLHRILSGPHQAPNQSVSFGGTIFTKPQAIPKRFCQQFTSSSSHKSNPKSRSVLRKLKRKHQLDTSFRPFTVVLTKKAIIQSSSSTAVGPDGLTSLHLKFFGPLGIAFLTEL